MKIEELLNYINVSFQTEGHKHCRPGWANMECPFCKGNVGLHLGIELENGYARCWRCGWHPITETIAKLSGKSFEEVRELFQQFGGRPRRKVNPISVRMKAFRYPSGTGKLNHAHKRYLERRNFDSSKLEREWDLLGTGPSALLDELDYKNRLIIPISWEGKVVSFQGRKINEKSGIKYQACPKNREIINHKLILYGKMDHWGGTGICVEGVTDVWRLGETAFAVFGIEYKLRQVREMVKFFKRIAVVFDDDLQAVKQARKLVGDLKGYGLDAFRIPIKGDPGSMTQSEANYLVKSIIK